MTESEDNANLNLKLIFRDFISKETFELLTNSNKAIKTETDNYYIKFINKVGENNINQWFFILAAKGGSGAHYSYFAGDDYDTVIKYESIMPIWYMEKPYYMKVNPTTSE